MVSEVGNFTLRIRPNIRKQRLQEQMSGLNSLERQVLTKIMNQSQYLRIRCKGDIRQATGSMFVIIEEEDEATCKFKIVNESKYITMHYAQHIVSSALWSQKLYINYAHEEKCKPSQSLRFTWESLIHQNVLKVSFSINQSTLQSDDDLELCELTPEQEVRCLPSHNKKHTHILIPFSKIGQKETICLLQNYDMKKLLGIKGPVPSQIHKVQVSIDTNGYTKFLKITDVVEDEQSFTLARPLRNQE